ncbi:MAG: sensor histidine kinase, partial [Bacteroidales bacterium]
SGFTKPENTVVRIIVGDEVYQSKSFKETGLSFSSDIKVNSEIIGKIDVFTGNQSHLESDNHFIEEEQNLLNAIADHISYIIKRNSDDKEMNKQNDLLQRLNAEKDKLFSVIGHDLRGPLSNIIGLTGILESKFNSMSPEKSLILLKGISQTANTIYQLLENLLEWAGFQRGTMVFRPRNVNLLSLVESVMEFFKQQLNAKQIIVKLKVPEDIFVQVDENMVLSTLRNLISNAIKFTRRHGEITITAGKNDIGRAEVAVADNGIGMDSKIIQNLFYIEGHVGRSGTENEPSSGLGLLLCKEFIEKHDGKIRVESLVGKGSTFYFSLPLAEKI